MKLYTVADLNKGSGVFDHTMREAGVLPSSSGGMHSSVAIGIIASAVKAGLSKNQMDEAFDACFGREDLELISRVQAMYTGDDSRVHLWSKPEGGRLELCHSLKYYCHPDWQFARHRHELY